VLVLDIHERRPVHRDFFTYADHFGDRYDLAKDCVLRTDGPEKHTSQRMMLEAEELMFGRIPPEVMRNICVFKQDDMQHALSFTRGLRHGLRGMDPGKSLLDNLGTYFTRDTTNMWQDRTTEEEVAYLERGMNSYGGMTARTGNPAELRFPAAQILKWIRQHPDEYKRTDMILPLPTLATSIGIGKIAPTDTGEGWASNMNTTNINNPAWNKVVTDLIDRNLLQKLGKMTHYDARAGRVSRWLVDRYGADPNAYFLAGTGDNPAYIFDNFSTGNSWVLNLQLPEVVASTGENNVFGCKPGRVLSLVCFSNGGGICKSFRDRYAGGSWERYRELAGMGKPGRHLMLPYLDDESVPRRKAGIVRDGTFDEHDPLANIRALNDSQVLAARVHTEGAKIPERILLIGGGGNDPVLRQTFADVFRTNVATLEDSDKAAVLSNAIAGAADFLNISYELAVRGFAKVLPGSEAEPNPDPAVSRLYEDALKRYERLEEKGSI
jgi:sugar (pentulose or hexulose) kinase